MNRRTVLWFFALAICAGQAYVLIAYDVSLYFDSLSHWYEILHQDASRGRLGALLLHLVVPFFFFVVPYTVLHRAWSAVYKRKDIRSGAIKVIPLEKIDMCKGCGVISVKDLHGEEYCASCRKRVSRKSN